MNVKSYTYPTGKLRISNKLLEATLNASGLGMTVVNSIRDASGKIIDLEYSWLNKITAAWAGKAVVGRHMLEIYPHVKEIGLFDAYVNTIENNQHLDFEEHYAAGEMWFRWSGVRLNDGLFIVVEDITERKRAVQEMLRVKDELARKTTDKYYTLFNSIDEAFCIIELIFDEKGKAVDWLYVETNQVFEQHTGLANATGRTAREIIPGLEPSWTETYTEVLHTGKPVRFERYSQGTDHWFDVYASRIGNGESGQIAVVFNDITKRKKLEQQRDDFISIASHELKTPVTSIKAYAEMIGDILEEAGDAVNASLMHKLNNQVDRLTTLIHALLDTTKMSQGHLALHLELFNLNELIDERAEEMQHTWQSHCIIVCHSGPLPVTADKERISQVLINLVSNAIKYSPAGSEVVITSRQVHKNIEVSVQDQGIGIPPEARQRVFDRFFRVSDQPSAAYQGMGLGLYIAAGIVHRHGGSIWAESKLGKGSVFYFTLPANTAE